MAKNKNIMCSHKWKHIDVFNWQCEICLLMFGEVNHSMCSICYPSDLKMKHKKSYLIVLGHGKRLVYDLDAISLEMPSDIKIRTWNPRLISKANPTTFEVIIHSMALFTLLGKNRKKGKKSWKKFIKGLI